MPVDSYLLADITLTSIKEGYENAAILISHAQTAKNPDVARSWCLQAGAMAERASRNLEQLLKAAK